MKEENPYESPDCLLRQKQKKTFQVLYGLGIVLSIIGLCLMGGSCYFLSTIYSVEDKVVASDILQKMYSGFITLRIGFAFFAVGIGFAFIASILRIISHKRIRRQNLEPITNE